ncbi:hypothetical protein GCM10007160_06370 [Litchfieldella qijiaojingensis]|uniref:Uncharacterized protein n=1 Tax=Litchfieldella qijiaojingensis TaxID=980347 RepID=A0ABQ2YG04_9GAMM|nr:hypothetical protein GCM10007160_06370 [Halomonas qijiaojingensis]
MKIQSQRQSCPQPAARSPQPAARSPQPAARSPQPAARSPQPAARSPQPAARSPQPAARSPYEFTLNLRVWVVYNAPSLDRWAVLTSCEGGATKKNRDGRMPAVQAAAYTTQYINLVIHP